jgi:prepilin-type N-terminal cleavage/methylation domain-containing protein
MRRLRDQRGLTLVEMLVTMLIATIVLGATVDSWARFLHKSSTNSKLQDQQDNARTAIDRLAKQLRNLANPTTASQSTIDTAEDFRLIFQTTDPGKKWVMYCLDRTNVASEILWYQVAARSSAVTTAMRSGCPSAATTDPGGTTNYWLPTVKRRLAISVTNAAVSSTRPSASPLFNYTSVDPNTGASSTLTPPLNSTETPLITNLSATLFVDNDVTKAPPETEIVSGVLLRNQNQAPTARFDASQAGGRKYTFNASSSSDPEQRTLDYDWYETCTTATGTTCTSSTPASLPNAAPANACPSGQTCVPDCPTKTTVQFPASTGPFWRCIGSGTVLTRDFAPDAITASTANVFLRVTDPGSLGDISDLRSGACPFIGTARVAATDCVKVTSGP